MKKFLSILKEIFHSFLWIALILLVADFVTKQVVLHNMAYLQCVPESKGFMYFQFVINDGVAFGLNFTTVGEIGNRIIMISLSVIGAAILIFVYAKFYKKLNAWQKAALALMIAGCFGNLIDRVFYGKEYLQGFDPNIETNGVVDFIAVDFGSYQFPRFNIADASLVVGTAMLLVILIIDEVKSRRAERAVNEENDDGTKLISKDEEIMNERGDNE